MQDELAGLVVLDADLVRVLAAPVVGPANLSS
jgi:hypothetical protein